MFERKKKFGLLLHAPATRQDVSPPQGKGKQTRDGGNGSPSRSVTNHKGKWDMYPRGIDKVKREEEKKREQERGRMPWLQQHPEGALMTEWPTAL